MTTHALSHVRAIMARALLACARVRAAPVLGMLRHPPLLEMVESLVGPEICGSSVFRLRPKVPSYMRGEVPFHQDAGYTMPHCDAVLMVTAWIPLVDATKENGCLHVLPFPSAGPVVTHCTGGKGGYLEIPPAAMPGGEPVAVEMAAGSVLLLHSLTPHASFANSTGKTRWSVDLRFCDLATAPVGARALSSSST
eukprot:SAG22_NODE_594_length_8738_cov_20.249219_10_plen_195_part_00